MDYIYNKTVPDTADDLDRCEKAARWLTVGDLGELVAVEGDGRRREIPVIGERAMILERLHMQAAYPSG
jgi:hypothetical protein